MFNLNLTKQIPNLSCRVQVPEGHESGRLDHRQRVKENVLQSRRAVLESKQK
jgi:hypothetical protein